MCTMDWKVVKIGGSVLGGREEVRRALQILQEEYTSPVLVVLSAFRGVTDVLHVAMEERKKGGEIAEKTLSVLREIHRDFQCHRIEELLQSLRDLWQKDYDEALYHEVLSIGEALSVAAFSAALEEEGISHGILWPQDLGLLVEKREDGYYFDLQASRENVFPLHHEEGLCLMPGFYGVDPGGQIRLVGRGGSDYTATAMACCLGAGEVHLWKDVAGIRTGHPEYLQETRGVRHLTYHEASELAGYGAAILQPRALEPARKKGISLLLYDFYQGKEPATIIDGGPVNRDEVTCLSFSTNYGLLHGSGSWEGGLCTVMGALHVSLAEAGIAIHSLHTGPNSMTLLLDGDRLEEAQNILQSSFKYAFWDLEVHDHLGLIACIGQGVLKPCALLERSLLALARSGVHARYMFGGMSPVPMVIMVEEGEMEKALEVVHQELFLKEERLYAKNLGCY